MDATLLFLFYFYPPGLPHRSQVCFPPLSHSTDTVTPPHAISILRYPSPPPFPLFLSLSLSLSLNHHTKALPGQSRILALPTMESFSLLKYWRGNTTTKDPTGANLRTSSTTTTISTSITKSAPETDDDDNGDGPFFDLEFAVPDDENDGDDLDKEKTTDGGDEEREDDDDDGEEFKFRLSPADDLFFNGNLIPVEPTSIVVDDTEQIVKPQFSLLKSASKFGVLMLKLKKSKTNDAGEKTEHDASVSLAKEEELERIQPRSRNRVGLEERERESTEETEMKKRTDLAKSQPLI